MKHFTHLGASYYTTISLSTTKRFEKLKDEIIDVIFDQHPGWNMWGFACGKTLEAAMIEFPPPPTVPHQHSKLFLGPDALPANNGHSNTDEMNSSSVTVEALKDFVNPAAVY